MINMDSRAQLLKLWKSVVGQSQLHKHTRHYWTCRCIASIAATRCPAIC